MDLSQFIALAVFAFVATVTPGPNNVMLTAIGFSYGVLRGIPALIGVSLGFAFMVFIVAMGLGSIMIQNPYVMLTLKYAGIAVVVWICWQIATAPVVDPTVTDQRASTSDRKGPIGFIGAAAFQWINPKAWLVATSITSAYFVAGLNVFAQAVLFFLVIAITATAACSVWLALGSVIGNYLKDNPRINRAFNVSMATTLLLTVLLLT